jgi:ubiquinone/menaquinone biosynthesis C-methylase UbiE
MKDIIDNVRTQYSKHPFPSVSRAGDYKIYGTFLRDLFESHGKSIEGIDVLDAGCGTGVMVTDTASQLPEANFQGIDLTPSSLEIAKSQIELKNLDNVKVSKDNLLELKMEGSFDYAYTWGVIHHTPNPEKCFKNIASKVKPGGFFMVGVYGHFGNWERRIQQELMSTVVPDKLAFDEKISAIRDWIYGDKNYKDIFTEPKCDMSDDDWVVDEFLHVHEQHISLEELANWYDEVGFEVIRMNDFYMNEISMDIKDHSTNQNFIDRVSKLPFPKRLKVIDMIERPYWACLVGKKK